MRAWKGRATCNSPHAPIPWCLQITRNEAFRRMRRMPFGRRARHGPPSSATRALPRRSTGSPRGSMSTEPSTDFRPTSECWLLYATRTTILSRRSRAGSTFPKEPPRFACIAFASGSKRSWRPNETLRRCDRLAGRQGARPSAPSPDPRRARGPRRRARTSSRTSSRSTSARSATTSAGSSTSASSSRSTRPPGAGRSSTTTRRSPAPDHRRRLGERADDRQARDGRSHGSRPSAGSVTAAAAAGGFDVADAHLTRTPITVDAQGWRDLAAELAALTDRVVEIQRESAARLAESQAAETQATVVLMLFDSSDIAQVPPANGAHPAAGAHKVTQSVVRDADRTTRDRRLMTRPRSTAVLGCVLSPPPLAGVRWIALVELVVRIHADDDQGRLHRQGRRPLHRRGSPSSRPKPRSSRC